MMNRNMHAERVVRVTIAVLCRPEDAAAVKEELNVAWLESEHDLWRSQLEVVEPEQDDPMIEKAREFLYAEDFGSAVDDEEETLNRRTTDVLQ